MGLESFVVCPHRPIKDLEDCFPCFGWDHPQPKHFEGIIECSFFWNINLISSSCFVCRCNDDLLVKLLPNYFFEYAVEIPRLSEQIFTCGGDDMRFANMGKAF